MLSVKEINLLEAQNEGLKKQNADLQKENAILKEENYNKLIAWEEMQAENEKLKALCDTYKTCYQAKHSDIKGLLFKYKQTLQEIKGIATALYMNEWLQRNETARQSIQLLQEVLDKAESEVE